MSSPRRRSVLLTLSLGGTGLLAASVLGMTPALAADTSAAPAVTAPTVTAPTVTARSSPDELRTELATLTRAEARLLPKATLLAMRTAAPSSPKFATGGELADLLPLPVGDPAAGDPTPVVDPGNNGNGVGVPGLPGNGNDPGNNPGNGNDPGNGNGNGGTGDPTDPVDPGDPTDPIDPVDPPVVIPPVVTPPVDTPPVIVPPVTTPPTNNPPSTNPPTNPPGTTPPSTTPSLPTDPGIAGGGTGANSGASTGGSSGGTVPTGTIGKVDATTADGATGVPDCSSADLTCRAVQETSASSPATTSVSSSALPNTGIDAGSIVGLGSSMVLMGVGVTVVARRRRPSVRAI